MDRIIDVKLIKLFVYVILIANLLIASNVSGNIAISSAEILSRDLSFKHLQRIDDDGINNQYDVEINYLVEIKLIDLDHFILNFSLISTTDLDKLINYSKTGDTLPDDFVVSKIESTNAETIFRIDLDESVKNSESQINLIYKIRSLEDFGFYVKIIGNLILSNGTTVTVEDIEIPKSGFQTTDETLSVPPITTDTLRFSSFYYVVTIIILIPTIKRRK